MKKASIRVTATKVRFFISTLPIETKRAVYVRKKQFRRKGLGFVLFSAMLLMCATIQAFCGTLLCMPCGSRWSVVEKPGVFRWKCAHRDLGLAHKLLDAVMCLCEFVTVHSCDQILCDLPLA